MFLVVGEHDMNATPELARDWFERIDAPLKRFETFPASGHGMLWQQPERFLRLMREEVLPLADAPAARAASASAALSDSRWSDSR